MEENKNLNNTPEENQGEDYVVDCGTAQPENVEEIDVEKEEKPAKVKKDKSEKKSNKSKKLKNTLLAKKGSYSIALTVIVITAVVIVNVLVSALSDRFVLEFDMTPDKENSISEENIEYIKTIDKEIDVIVCSTEDEYASGVGSNAQQAYNVTYDNTAISYFNQTVTLVKKYNAYNSKINVKFVDPQSSDFTAITSDYGADGLEYGSIIVSTTKEDGTKRYKKLGFTDIYNVQEDSTYAAYGITAYTVVGNELETALTGGISYVASNNDVQVALYTGHSSTNLTDSYIDLLEANSYEVDVISDGFISQIPDKYEIIVFPAPSKDFVESELNAISKFLENDGKYEKGMMVFADATAPYLTDFYAFLKDWGIEIHDGVVYEPGEGYASPDDATVLVSANTGNVDDLAEMQMCVTGSNVPITPAFEEKGGKTTVSIVETMPDTVIAPKGTTVNWGGVSEQEARQYSVIIESTHTAYDTEGEEMSSKIAVFSSPYFLQSVYNETASYSNKNLSLAMVDRAAKIDDMGISFVPKSINTESYYESVTAASANVIRIIFMIVLPIALLVIGTVIFIKRRNA